MVSKRCAFVGSILVIFGIELQLDKKDNLIITKAGFK